MPSSARLPLRSAPPRRLVVTGNFKCHWHARFAAAARTSDTGALADGHGRAGGLGRGGDSDGGRGRRSLRRGCTRTQSIPNLEEPEAGDGRRIEKEQGQPRQGRDSQWGGRCCVVRRGTASGRSLAACGGTRNVHAALDGDPRPAATHCGTRLAELRVMRRPARRGPPCCTSWAGLPVRFRRSLSEPPLLAALFT